MPACAALGGEVEHERRLLRSARFSAPAAGRNRDRGSEGRQQRGGGPHVRRHPIHRAVGCGPMADHHLDEQLLALIEIPKGSRNKYEYDEGIGKVDPRSLPLLVDGLPDRLRLPDRPPRPRRGPARLPGLRVGGHVPRLRHRREADRPVQDGGREGRWTTRSSASRTTTPAGTTPRRSRTFPSSSSARSPTSSRSTSSSRGRRSRSYGWRSREEALEVIEDGRRLQDEYEAGRAAANWQSLDCRALAPRGRLDVPQQEVIPKCRIEDSRPISQSSSAPCFWSLRSARWSRSTSPPPRTRRPAPTSPSSVSSTASSCSC